jgi:hypothetical protein
MGMGYCMKITLDKATMDDDLYNALLTNFVKQAIVEGVDVTKHTQFDDWKIECELRLVQ